MALVSTANSADLKEFQTFGNATKSADLQNCRDPVRFRPMPSACQRAESDASAPSPGGARHFGIGSIDSCLRRDLVQKHSQDSLNSNTKCFIAVQIATTMPNLPISNQRTSTRI